VVYADEDDFLHYNMMVFRLIAAGISIYAGLIGARRTAQGSGSELPETVCLAPCAVSPVIS